jgi:hypothetical protein
LVDVYEQLVYRMDCVGACVFELGFELGVIVHHFLQVFVVFELSQSLLSL